MTSNIYDFPTRKPTTITGWNGKPLTHPSTTPHCLTSKQGRLPDMILTCGRKPGHDGPHFDSMDGIYWQSIAADEAGPEDLIPEEDQQ